jgi:pimeloyl-ACP methyl ester carboxylesterase
MAMDELDIDGVHVTDTACTSGDAVEPVVLLHGFSDNANTWRRIVPPLAERYRVIALDLRGHGRSSRPSRSLPATRTSSPRCSTRWTSANQCG